MPASDATAGPSAVSTRNGVWAIIEDGLLVGLAGAAIVAVWFLLLDAVRNVPFHTPTLLGSVIFRGAAPSDVTEADTVMVFSYTGLHVVLFLAAGVAIAWMFSIFEENPQFGLVLLLLFFLFEAILLGLELSIVPRLVGELGTWAVALANLFAAVGMFWFLLKRRPGAFQRLRAAWDE